METLRYVETNLSRTGTQHQVLLAGEELGAVRRQLKKRMLKARLLPTTISNLSLKVTWLRRVSMLVRHLDLSLCTIIKMVLL